MRYESSRVLAVIVSYFGSEKLTATVDALAPQVGRILVVDNGSDEATLAVLRRMERDQRIVLQALGENRGIGYALNRGWQLAEDWGFEWLLTMDQDSVADRNMVHAMLEVARAEPGLRCVSPNIGVHGRSPGSPKAGPVAYAITSGNLVHTDVLRSIGPFNEDFFIDCVDFDFSLRARAGGFAIHKAPGSLLNHELGSPVGRRPFERFYAQHSPLRRYYMFRNFMYLAKAHLFREPKFILKLLLAHLVLLTLMVFYEPQLGKNVKFIGRALLDFFHGRSGAYAGPPN